MAATDCDPQARAKALREKILRSMSKEELLDYAISLQTSPVLESADDSLTSRSQSPSPFRSLREA